MTSVTIRSFEESELGALHRLDRLIMDVTAAEFRDVESSGADEIGAWLTGETQNPWLGFGETDLPR